LLKRGFASGSAKELAMVNERAWREGADTTPMAQNQVGPKLEIPH